MWSYDWFGQTIQNVVYLPLWQQFMYQFAVVCNYFFDTRLDLNIAWKLYEV